MNTIIRNFFHTLRRFRIATLLNILGLSVAFTAFIVIMMQVSYHIRFDSSIPDADNVYRINLELNGDRIAATPRPVGEGFAAYSPYIRTVAVANAMYATVFDQYFTIETEDTTSHLQTYAEKMMQITAGYIDIFQPKMVEGYAEALLEPDKVLIPQSIATRIFKGESAIDKRLRGENVVWTVGGVYKDFPKNSSVHNFILVQLPEHDHWALNYETYVSIDPSQNASALLAEYIATIEPMFKNEGYDNAKFFLTPIKTIHFDTTIGFDTVEKTSTTTLWILTGIALVILIIAAINFTNYSIALTPLRIKSINTQKVLGATQRTLCSSLVIEAILISLTSFGIALFMVYLLSLTPVTHLLPDDLILYNNISLLCFISAAALFTGLFAGVYPAYFATSFAPALVLKGNFGLSPRGRQLRNSLVGAQFIASFALIIVAIFMYIQTNYMQHSDPGYSRNKTIVVATNRQFADQHELFAKELQSLPGIESVGYSEALLADRDHYDTNKAKLRESTIIFNSIRVDHNFLQTVNIPLLDGRYFTKSDAQTENAYFIIFNEQARKEYDLQL